MVDENRQLEVRLSELQDEVGQLEADVAETLNKLRKARHAKETLVGELESRLEETRVQLAATVDKLEQTQIELERTNRKLARVRRASRKPPVKPARPRLRGLRDAQILSQINKYHRDFDVCVSEWSEREKESGAVFAVQFQVDSRGVPQGGSKTGGIDDQVVYECIVGLLEDKLRFPATDGITIANVGFYYELGTLRVTVSIADVVEDIGRGARPEPATEAPTEAAVAPDR